MLAASPSHSPTTFRVGPFRNGSGVLPLYQSSPRKSAPSSPKSPKSVVLAAPAPPSPPFRASYQDASTQYSPMGETAKNSPLVTPAEGNVLGQSATQAAPLGGPTTTITSHYLPTTSSAAPPVPAPSVPASQPQSPKTKRRQFKETAESSSSSSTTRSIPSKRTKSAKTAAKVLPARYELCPVEDMVILIADMISELIETNDNLPLRDVVLTRFHSRFVYTLIPHALLSCSYLSRTPPGISVIDYLQRLAKHATLSPPLLLSMVYYIDRLCSLYPAFSITSLTVHRFLITAATVSAKGLSDSFWNNSTYARVGGIKLAELGLLELEFLYRLDWRIVPNPEVLVDYYRGLVGRTEDYILESDVDSGHAMQVDPVQDEVQVSNTARDSSDGTDTKWNKWMKDVADSSVIKKYENEDDP